MASERTTQEALIQHHGIRHTQVGQRLEACEPVFGISLFETVNETRNFLWCSLRQKLASGNYQGTQTGISNASAGFKRCEWRHADTPIKRTYRALRYLDTGLLRGNI